MRRKAAILSVFTAVCIGIGCTAALAAADQPSKAPIAEQTQKNAPEQAEKARAYGLYIKDDNLFYTDGTKTMQLTKQLIVNDETADRWHQINAAQLANAVGYETRQYQGKKRIFYPDHYQSNYERSGNRIIWCWR